MHRPLVFGLLALSSMMARAAYVGYVDSVNGAGDALVSGWACNTAQPDSTADVLIYREGRYVGRATSGAIELKMGGPSAPLTPLYNRRTVYGRVSRYRLDEFLQLFDFPSPNLSSERRFATSSRPLPSLS